MRALLAAAALAPALLAAQTPDVSADRYSFYLVVGDRDTVITERVWRMPAQIHGEFLEHQRGARVSYVAALAPDASITTVAAHTYRSAADTAGEIATFEVSGDQVVAQIGASERARIPGAVGLVPMINPSAAFIEQVIRRALVINRGLLTPGATAKLPVLVIGAPQSMTATVTGVSADSVVLSYASVTMRLAVAADGRLLGGRAPSQGLTIVRGPAGDPLVAPVKDYTAPPGAPYRAQDVTIRTPAGIRLTGTLTLPTGVRGPVPAVVTITGSGPEDRDEQSPALPAYRPFRQLADTLGRRGIAVLRLDDRGMGGSDVGPRTVTSEDFADDIRAGVAYLRTRSEIDGARIALVGHSEGGVIAPIVAESDPKLRGMVLMAATASPGSVILRSQQHYLVDTVAKLAGEARESALAQYQRNTDSVAAAVPWLRWFIEHDPSAVARRVRTPVLIVQGEADHQVPASEAEKLAAAFRAGGNRRVTVRTFPETNHLFVTDTTGGFAYERLPSLDVRRDVLGAIADWLSDTLR